MYVKRANLGFRFEEMPQRIVNLLVLFALIFFGILSLVPKAQSQNLIGLSRRNEHDLIHETALVFSGSASPCR